jgi:hypothetical protein
MGASASEVGYTSATTGRGDHEVHKGHVVALEKNIQHTSRLTTDNRLSLEHAANDIPLFLSGWTPKVTKTKTVIVGVQLWE